MSVVLPASLFSILVIARFQSKESIRKQVSVARKFSLLLASLSSGIADASWNLLCTLWQMDVLQAANLK